MSLTQVCEDPVMAVPFKRPFMCPLLLSITHVQVGVCGAHSVYLKIYEPFYRGKGYAREAIVFSLFTQGIRPKCTDTESLNSRSYLSVKVCTDRINIKKLYKSWSIIGMYKHMISIFVSHDYFVQIE